MGGLWDQLPDLIMEKVYGYLSMRERYYASMVCWSWYRAFYLPKAWEVFVFDETTLTRKRFNYYTGWQYILDHLRTQLCLSTVGEYFRILVFSPMTNFYNLYEFMNMISFYAEQQHLMGEKCTVKDIGRRVHTLKYTFPCNMSPRQEADWGRLYGTGGKLLAAVKRLMSNLCSLRHLELVDLMLDNFEALHLLDQVCCDHCLTLQTLRLINPSKSPCQLLHVGVFINLQVLMISPQNLGEDLLYLLGESQLKELHIVQNRYTPQDVAPMNPKAWTACARRNTRLRVHLSLESIRERCILWQERAPVASILYNSPQCKLQDEILNKTIEWYRDKICAFGHLGLPRYHQQKSFNGRIDPLLLMMAKECPKLHTLIVRERISTATVLLLAENAISLKRLYIRRNAVILRCDWPRNPEWSQEHFNWLKSNSRSYAATELQVSERLGYSWHMLSDKEFKALAPHLY
ncbi:hypothetical protein AAG570_000267 [Ranatra chinensis]|uniref:F-box domain-containing protein n=1 Tax=Ranatra chinensis TaxID=642074 RepID=A0ABD0YWV3_9HEMI